MLPAAWQKITLTKAAGAPSSTSSRIDSSSRKSSLSSLSIASIASTLSTETSITMVSYTNRTGSNCNHQQATASNSNVSVTGSDSDSANNSSLCHQNAADDVPPEQVPLPKGDDESNNSKLDRVIEESL